MKKTIFLASAIAILGACSDWTDHYDDAVGAGETAGSSIYDQIAANSELSDFKAVLDSTHLYSNNRRTSLHYSDMLGGNQFYTVWAPKNGTFNRDSLLRLCSTTEGDSLVGTHFLANHIARYRHSAGTNEAVLMLNGKTKHLAVNYMDGALIEQANMPARNGILNVLRNDYQYHYNIYECLVSLDRFKHIGKFLRSYQVDEFDPELSLEQGIDENGKTVYADSVFRTHNIILNTIDHIDSEDSTFYMFVPSASLWERIYPEAFALHDYAMTEKGDSLCNLYSHFSLIQDLVFNPLWQTSIMDSITSTTWGSKYSYPYHVYYKPFAQGGLMSYAVDSIVCSNGVIYEMDEWPFEKNMLYFKKITCEAEGLVYDSYESASKQLTLNRYGSSCDSISGGYICVKPSSASSAYYIEYEIQGVLSGTYDVNIVYLPKTVFDPTLNPASSDPTVKRQFRPCKFIAELTYIGRDGQECHVSTDKKYRLDPTAPSLYVEDKNGGDYVMDCNFNANTASTRAFVTNPYRVDTLHLATFTFPVCNYGMTRCTNRLKITNNVRSNQASSYSPDMYIDQILLIPHNDETKQ